MTRRLSLAVGRRREKRRRRRRKKKRRKERGEGEIVKWRRR